MTTTAAKPGRILTEDSAFLSPRRHTTNEDEASPLLSPAFSELSQNDNAKLLPSLSSLLSLSSSSSSSPPSLAPTPHIHRRIIALLLMASICLIEMAAVMMQAPLNALMEDIMCREKLLLPPAESTSMPLTLADDPRCKTSDVQGKLAMMRGWQSALDTLPSMLCAIPYALMADRVGRKPVLLLAFLGLMLSIYFQTAVLLLSSRGLIPLWAIYFSSLCGFIGAFSCTGPAMVYTTIGDVVPPAERAAVFFHLSVALLVGELLGSPLAGTLMNLGGPWLPIVVSLAGGSISFLLLFFVPETLAHRTEDEVDGISISSSIRQYQNQAGTKLRSFTAVVTNSYRELWAFTTANTPLMWLMVPLTFFVLGRMVQDALLQYATKRYDMNWSSASVLLAARPASNLVLFVAVFPYISHVLTTTCRMTTPAKDLLMARWTGLVGAVGAFLVALSATPTLLAVSLAVFAVGSGFSPLLRSLLNTLVEQDHLAMVNSLVSFLELLGAFVAGPVLSKALSIGIGMGGFWVGLPFFAAGLSLSFSAGLVWVYRLPKAMAGADGVEGDEEESLVGSSDDRS